VSVAILWNDGRSWLGASGRADAAGRIPMTTDTAFALASISKTFTAAVVLQLVGEGKVGLDDRVAPLLPAFRLDRRITVRMLLDHSSGLPDFFFGKGIDQALQGHPNAAWTAQRTWRYVRKHRPVPGKVWSYSNTNYMLLGELVKGVTGRSIATEVRSRLLDPLDLSNAWYQGVEKPRGPGTSGFRLITTTSGGVRALPVAPRSDVMPFRSVVTAAGGAGSIAATAEDTARWMQAFAGGKVLPARQQVEMISDMARTRALDSRIPYGLGIQGVPIAGRPALGHSGRYLGFRNVVRYLPGEGVTIAVLTNQGGYDPTRIATALLKLVLPPQQ
jgi:D-alanyl-D-alanine carboxypeptidase